MDTIKNKLPSEEESFEFYNRMCKGTPRAARSDKAPIIHFEDTKALDRALDYIFRDTLEKHSAQFADEDLVRYLPVLEDIQF